MSEVARQAGESMSGVCPKSSEGLRLATNGQLMGRQIVQLVETSPDHPVFSGTHTAVSMRSRNGVLRRNPAADNIDEHVRLTLFDLHREIKEKRSIISKVVEDERVDYALHFIVALDIACDALEALGDKALGETR